MKWNEISLLGVSYSPLKNQASRGTTLYLVFSYNLVYLRVRACMRVCVFIIPMKGSIVIFIDTLVTKKIKHIWAGYKLNKLATLTKMQFISISWFGRPGKILSHSFRRGLATMMAKNGYSDEEIMRTGRWSSSAFLTYCKLGRVKRMAVAQEMAYRFSKA